MKNIKLPSLQTFSSPQTGNKYFNIVRFDDVHISYRNVETDTVRVRVESISLGKIMDILSNLNYPSLWGEVKSDSRISVLVSKKDFIDVVTDAFRAVVKSYL